MARSPEPKNVNLIIERFEYRAVFSKTGRAKYISHLDLMRAFQRAFKRAHLPIWYTQGFNPHVYIMFPLALPLGTDSRVEIMDFALTEDLDCEEVKKRLGEQTPVGLDIISIARPVHKHTAITAAEYFVRLKTDKTAEETAKLFDEFISRDKIEIEKRTKKKTINLVDIKPHINALSCEAKDGETEFKFILPCGSSFNLNINVVIDTFCDMYGLEIVDIYTERTKILIENGESFT